MLPKYRRLVEKLAQAGLLKVICGTDTLGVGVNVPIRTVLFTALTKYDGNRVRTLRAREFHQIAGRAGRAGFDTAGYVVAQAPEHVIENEKALAKAGDDPKKRRKVVRKKAPEGFVGWTDNTFEKLIASDPEPLTSRFRVTHTMLLSVIARPGNAFEAMRHLLEDNHEPRKQQLRHIRRAIAIYRSLLDGGIVEKLDQPDAEGRIVRLTVDLQQDFALNQPLSTFALASFELLDPESPSYALDMVSVVESTLDDPRQILAAQQNKARGEAVAAMKADGVEYEERMERLQDVSYPKPLEELLFHAYNTYRKSHPWVGDHPLSPKSVIRDMYERAMSFTELTSYYELARTEGIVLRYLMRRLQGPRPHGPRRPEVGRSGGLDRLARRDGASGRLQSPRRVGATGQPRGDDRRGGPGEGRPGQAGDLQRACLPCPRPQRHVPPCRAGRPRPGG